MDNCQIEGLEGQEWVKLTDVGGRTPIFQVTIAFSGDVAWNTNRSTTVGDTGAERADVTGLVATSETHVVVVSVDGDVLVVLLGKLFDSGFDVLHTALLTHCEGTVVGVASTAVPVAAQWLGVEGNLDTPLLGKTDEKIASHPEVVTHLDTLTRADLELPLSRHDLGVDTADLDTGIQADTVMSLNQVTCVDLSGA